MDTNIQVLKLGFVNVFLVKAEAGYVLIDTGVAQQWKQLETQLLRAGALPDKLKLVVITHGDYDHTGNCANLQQQYRARIAMHPGDVEMVKSGRLTKRQAKNLLGKFFLQLGTLIHGAFQCFEPDLLLADGQELGEYGLAARVLHTPGHTRGSIAVLTADGQLFAGDTVTNQGKPDSALFIENESALQQSLRLLKRSGARRVYPGHGQPFNAAALAAIKEA